MSEKFAAACTSFFEQTPKNRSHITTRQSKCRKHFRCLLFKYIYYMYYKWVAEILFQVVTISAVFFVVVDVIWANTFCSRFLRWILEFAGIRKWYGASMCNGYEYIVSIWYVLQVVHHCNLMCSVHTSSLLHTHNTQPSENYRFLG